MDACYSDPHHWGTEALWSWYKVTFDGNRVRLRFSQSGDWEGDRQKVLLLHLIECVLIVWLPTLSPTPPLIARWSWVSSLIPPSCSFFPIKGDNAVFCAHWEDEKSPNGNSLVVQCLALGAFITWTAGSILGQGTKIRKAKNEESIHV